MSEQSDTSRNNRRLLFEIAVILCCKLCLIFCLWYFFFGPEKRIDQTPEAVAAGILDRTQNPHNTATAGSKR